MAISPPSDILLDVANAADPAKVQAAKARLAKLAAAPPTAVDGDFGKAMAAAVRDAKTGVGVKDSAAGAFKSGLASDVPLHQTIGAQGTTRSSMKSASETYRKFEAVLLQNVVETMLPKNDQLYGDKMSAGVYRSMMAEQFAAQLAKNGGIGIAKAIAAKHPAADHSAPHVAPPAPSSTEA